jgi:glutathione-regulated potassium-efflux system ancillary protein KefC
LLASGVKATVLDHNPEQIELLRRFDFRVYYGDATRLDLLEAAGAARAKLLVLAIDDPDTSVALVEAVREHFPSLQIVARARNVGHWSRLRAQGVRVVERETFESAVLIGRRALEALGVEPYDANERANTFRRHNVRTLEDILPHWQDLEKRTNMARSAREELEKQMEQDRADVERHGAKGWHSDAEALRDDSA